VLGREGGVYHKKKSNLKVLMHDVTDDTTRDNWTTPGVRCTTERECKEVIGHLTQ